MEVGLVHIETNGVKSELDAICESDILCLSICLLTQTHCICKKTQDPLYFSMNGLNKSFLSSEV